MNVYMGVEQMVKNNWQQILGDPPKPGNWKDDTYQNKLPELRLKQMAEAPQHVAAGYCSRIAVIIPRTATLSVQAREKVTTRADGWLQFVGQVHDFLLCIDDIVNINPRPITIIGINTNDVLAQIGWSALDAGIPAPAWLWNTDQRAGNGISIVNLYSCSGAKHGTDMSVQAFLDYWTKNDKLLDGSLAEMQAERVLLTAARMGF